MMSTPTPPPLLTDIEIAVKSISANSVISMRKSFAVICFIQ